MRRTQRLPTHLGPVGLLLVLSTTPACLVLKSQHDALAADVNKLNTGVAERDKQVEEALQKANELVAQLEEKLAEVEALLRRNQADLGLRVEDLEIQAQELRGKAENAEYVASAGGQELQELRSEIDTRLQTLEQKLNEATNIPEGKTDLLKEAEKQLKRKRYKKARRLFRTYQSRYPDDPKIADVRFNIGLTYFSERDYKAALGEFYHVIQKAPKSGVVPDSLYYSGLAFAKLGQCQSAVAYFEALQKPKTAAPDRYKTAAKKQIDILKKDKGDICLDREKAAAGAKPQPVKRQKTRSRK